VPIKRNASTEDITTSVLRALWDSGRRKLATPFEMASSPVSEEPPFAYARSKVKNASPIKSPLPWVPSLPWTSRWTGGWGIMWSVPTIFL